MPSGVGLSSMWNEIKSTLFSALLLSVCSRCQYVRGKVGRREKGEFQCFSLVFSVLACISLRPSLITSLKS